MNRLYLQVCGWITAGLSLWGTSQATEVWPGFRGRGDSHLDGGQLPWSWEARGQVQGNWSIRLKGYGQSSPVVWKNVVYVTSISGEMKEHLHLFAFHLADGALLWEKEFSATQKVKDSDTVSRGAPTPVVDDGHVYAMFESGDLFALDHSGNLKWERSIVKDYGEFKGPHGYASSPLLVNDLCVIQVAHSGPSYILALDRKTGQNRWKVDHPSQTGWSSPAVYDKAGQSQILISTAGSVRSLNPENGATLWISEEIQGNSTASPTVVGDLVVIGAATERGGGGGRRSGTTPPGATPSTSTTSSAPAQTSQGEQPGDVTSKPPGPSGNESAGSPSSSERPQSPPSSKPTGSGVFRLDDRSAEQARLVWKSDKVSSGYASPVVVGDFAYFVNRVGVVTCAKLSDGAIQWQHRLPGEVWASPVANNGHVTFFGKFGFVVTLKSGPQIEEVAESNISTTEVVYGVAAVDNSWIVRTGRGLIRISDPSNTKPSSPTN